MCKVFSHFSGFLHHFALAELATSSIWVKNSFNPLTLRAAKTGLTIMEIFF